MRTSTASKVLCSVMAALVLNGFPISQAAELNISSDNNNCILQAEGNMAEITFNCTNVPKATIEGFVEEVESLRLSVREMEALLIHWTDQYRALYERIETAELDRGQQAISQAALTSGDLGLAESLLDAIESLSPTIARIDRTTSDTNRIVTRIFSDAQNNYKNTDRLPFAHYSAIPGDSARRLGGVNGDALLFIIGIEEFVKIHSESVQINLQLYAGDGTEHYRFRGSSAPEELYAVGIKSNIFVPRDETKLWFCITYFDLYLRQYAIHTGVLTTESVHQMNDSAGMSMPKMMKSISDRNVRSFGESVPSCPETDPEL